MDWEEKITQWIDEHKDEYTKFLQKLVQEESTRGQESKGQAVIVEKCRELGLTLDIWEIGDHKLFHHPEFHSDRSDFKGNPNVVGILKGTGGGKSLIVNGHIDVVPVGDEKDWTVPPFSGMLKDGKVYGRGTTDMKGGTVAILMAMDAIISLGIKLKGDIIFQSVIEEESGGAGTLATLIRGYKADGAIIPEPTSLKIFPIQQGSIWFRLKVKGKQAHGGTRYEGINAIEKAMAVMNQLKKLEDFRNKGITDPLYESVPIPVPINIGKIEGGTWPSSVPDLVVIEGRYGIKPNESVEDAKKEFVEALNQLKEIDSWFQSHPVELEWFGARWLPGYLDIDHPLVQTVSGSYKKILKTQPVIQASPWGTDGGILSQIGNIPVVVFGPGVTEKAHDFDEFIELKSLWAAAKIIACSMIEWCQIDE